MTSMKQRRRVVRTSAIDHVGCPLKASDLLRLPSRALARLPREWRGSWLLRDAELLQRALLFLGAVLAHLKIELYKEFARSPPELHKLIPLFPDHRHPEPGVAEVAIRPSLSPGRHLHPSVLGHAHHLLHVRVPEGGDLRVVRPAAGAQRRTAQELGAKLQGLGGARGKQHATTGTNPGLRASILARG